MSYPPQPGQPPEQPGGEPNPYGQPPGGAPQYGGGYGAGPAAAQPGDPGTLDLPYYGIGFVDAVKRAFQKYARFDGRASRSELWWFVLFVVVLGTVLYVPVLIFAAAEMTALAVVFGVLAGAFYLATLVPYLAVGARRLHDAGFSAWLLLLLLCVSIVVIILWILPSKPEGAKHDRVSGGYPG